MTDYPAAFPSRSAYATNFCLWGVGVASASSRACGDSTSHMTTRGATAWAIRVSSHGRAFVLGSREGDTPA